MKSKSIEIVYLKITEIKPYWKNPRHNDVTVEALVEYIPEFDFNQPVVVDKEGVIVKGHARYAAAVKLGMSEIPCIISENDDKTNKIDRIADNRVFELSKWDAQNMGHLEVAQTVRDEHAKRRLPERLHKIVCPYCGKDIELYL